MNYGLLVGVVMFFTGLLATALSILLNKAIKDNGKFNDGGLVTLITILCLSLMITFSGAIITIIYSPILYGLV